MIDLTKQPPFANAAWVNEPNAPCLWCAGTGHVHGDPEGELCDCPEDSAPNVAQAIAEALVLESPILKLINERNEARELVKRMLRATDGVTDSKEYYAAMLEARRAEMRWKGGAQ